MLRSPIRLLRRYTNVLKRTEWWLAVYLKVTLTRLAFETLQMLKVFPFRRFAGNDWKNLLGTALLNFLPLYIQRRVYGLFPGFDCIAK